MKTSIPVALVLALVAGCAHDPNPQAKTSQTLAVAPGAPFGAIVGSVGHESSSPYAASHVVFRRTGAIGGGILIFQPRYIVPSPKDFETSTESGTVVVAKLPPGNYQIVSVGAMWHAGMTRFTPSLSLAEPISFTVKEGGITYLGRYVLGKSGGSPTALPFLRIESSADGDLKVASKRNPELISLSAGAFEVPSGRRDR